MSIDEVRKQAPQDATHYSDIGIDVIYIKESYKHGWKCFVFGSWQPYIAEDNEEIKPLN